MKFVLDVEATLPIDGTVGTLVGRVRLSLLKTSKAKKSWSFSGIQSFE
jgi:hypothetical protein